VDGETSPSDARRPGAAEGAWRAGRRRPEAGAAGPGALQGAPPAAGPRAILAVRHGESVANAAFAVAEAAGAEDVGIDCRDADLALTPLGRAQSAALGRRLAAHGADASVTAADGPPQSVWCSPYRRARETAAEILGAFDRAGLPRPPLRVDERLRDRELGVLEMLTATAVRRRHPEEHARRKRLGELYYRPAGGESWADVALRLRSLLRDLVAEEPGRRVLLVGHDAVVILLRYVLEGLDESALPPDGSPDRPANASLTRWTRGPDGTLRLEAYNLTDHLEL